MKHGGNKVDEEWLHRLFDICTCKQWRNQKLSKGNGNQSKKTFFRHLIFAKLKIPFLAMLALTILPFSVAVISKKKSLHFDFVSEFAILSRNRGDLFSLFFV